MKSRQVRDSASNCDMEKGKREVIRNTNMSVLNDYVFKGKIRENKTADEFMLVNMVL